MHWVLQNNLFRERGFEEMREYLESNNIPFSEHKVVPFVGRLEPDIDLNNELVMCIGSYSMRHVAKEKNWLPGVFQVPDYKECINQWGKHLMLNGDAYFIYFRGCNANWYKPPHPLSMPDPVFIRPASDAKYFAGCVMSLDDLREWVHKVVELEEDDGTSLRGNTLVMLSEPKEILQEYRFWIVDHEVVTSSTYKVGSRVVNRPETETVKLALELAWIVASNYMWQPARAYVLDICMQKGDDNMPIFKIVEINNINSAGFYGANVPKLVNALNSMEF